MTFHEVAPFTAPWLCSARWKVRRIDQGRQDGMDFPIAFLENMMPKRHEASRNDAVSFTAGGGARRLTSLLANAGSERFVPQGGASLGLGGELVSLSPHAEEILAKPPARPKD